VRQRVTRGRCSFHMQVDVLCRCTAPRTVVVFIWSEAASRALTLTIDAVVQCCVGPFARNNFVCLPPATCSIKCLNQSGASNEAEAEKLL